MKLQLLILSIALLVCPKCLLGQQITYVSENRFVESTVINNFTEFDPVPTPGTTTDETIFANGFQNFEAVVSQGSAQAGQNSNLGSDSLTATGFAEGFGIFNNFLFGSGQSVFEAIFDLSAPAEYSLELSVIDAESFDIAIVGPSLAIEQAVSGFAADFVPISETGTLDAGQYSVLIDVRNGPVSESLTGSFNLDFQIATATVPEPSTSTLIAIGIILGACRRKKAGIKATSWAF